MYKYTLAFKHTKRTVTVLGLSACILAAEGFENLLTKLFPINTDI